jgi:hypothetical protein
MFGPSVKSVPGWWVSIVPMLIGVPVALTPALGPHDEMLADAVPPALVPVLPALVPVPDDVPVLALVAALDVVAAPPPELLELLLLLPHPANAKSAAAATDASPIRIRGMR